MTTIWKWKARLALRAARIPFSVRQYLRRRARMIRELPVELPGHEIDAGWDVPSRHAVLERDQVARFAVWQWVQHDALHNCEDRRVRPNRERQRQHSGQRERGTAHQSSVGKNHLRAG